MQGQLERPVCVLLVLYSSDCGHAVHVAPDCPGSEKVCAGHAPQTTSAVAEQTEEPS